MKELKIFVITNVEKFKELCERKLGTNITAEDYIEMATFKNEHVFLVPQVLPTILGSYVTEKYDIYNTHPEDGKVSNIVEINEDDITKLFYSGSLEDMKSHYEWKNTLGFKVTDMNCFYKKLLKILTPEEIVAVQNVLNRSDKAKYKYEFYIISNEKDSTIYMNNEIRNLAYKLPYTNLCNNDLSYFIKNSIVKTIDCKTKNTNLLKFEDKVYRIAPDDCFLRCFHLYKHTDRYEAKATIKGENIHKNRSFHAWGKTEQEAKEKLQKKLNKALAHGDIKITSELYKDLLF